MTAVAESLAAQHERDPGSHRVLELEGLRAVAAGAVVLTHAGFTSGAIGRPVLPGFLARMDIGVAVFFVLSGYLLYRPHARANAALGHRQTVRTFLARRAARLIPAWLLVLLGAAVLVPESRSVPGTTWGANLLQVQALRPDWLLPGLAQLWSLSTEVMFYLALPVLAAGLARAARGRAGLELLGLVLLAVFAQGFRVLAGAGFLPDGYSWLQTLPATLDWFAAGMGLAWLTAHPGRARGVKAAVRDAPHALWVMAAAVLWVLTTRLAGPYDLTQPTSAESTLKHLGYGAIALLVVAPSAIGARSAIGDLLSSPPMVFLGRVSYGTFLWHLPVMFAWRKVWGYTLFDGHFWLTLGGTLLVTIPIAALSWRFVEAPIQRRVREATERRSPRAVLHG